jgi:hypothetical protein
LAVRINVTPDKPNRETVLDEICALLAEGVIRLCSRQSSGLSHDFRESLVDFPPDQSVHADVLTESGDQG